MTNVTRAEPVRVLGIDPGTATTGYALVEGLPGGSDEDCLHEYGTIRTTAGTPLPERLRILHASLVEKIADLEPEVVAVEELFFARNASTALLVGHARGVILLAAAQADLTVYEYKPREIKLALTGYGAADKLQVQHMLQLMLQLAEPPRPDDAADAVATALCHLQSCRLRDYM